MIRKGDLFYMDYEDILLECETRMEEAMDALDKRFVNVRAGRANPSMLDGIMVEYYGVPTPLKQLANISIPEARQLSIKPFDKSILNAIEKTVDINAELLEETIAEHHEHHHRENHHHEHHHEHQHGEECTCGHHHDHEEHHHHEHGEECTCGHHHDHDHEHHHADDVFTSWGIETHKKYSADEIKDILNRLSDNDEYGVVLRAKGIVASDDGKWIHFDFVPEEFEVRFGEADYTGRICVIGTKLNTDVLEKTFK